MRWAGFDPLKKQQKPRRERELRPGCLPFLQSAVLCALVPRPILSQPTSEPVTVPVPPTAVQPLLFPLAQCFCKLTIGLLDLVFIIKEGKRGPVLSSFYIFFLIIMVLKNENLFSVKQ